MRGMDEKLNRKERKGRKEKDAEKEKREVL